MIQFIYASWNLKNLSTNSLKREWIDCQTKKSHTNIQAYTRLITEKNVDIIGFLEVTIGTGQEAIKAISSALNGKNTGSYSDIITDDRTAITRRGEYNAVVYRTANFNSSSDKQAPTVKLFPKTSQGGSSFGNRVPVLFKLPVRSQTRFLQIITWHCPQPAHVVPFNELKALGECINDGLLNQAANGLLIDGNQPCLISGDFNFDTDPDIIPAWNNCLFKYNGPLPNAPYLRSFKPMLLGNKTTLVRKDPETLATPYTPKDFNDLLCNAYDTILINEPQLTYINAVNAPVINHLKEFIANNKITFTIPRPRTIPRSSASTSMQMEIDEANKISDHCMIYGFFQFN